MDFSKKSRGRSGLYEINAMEVSVGRGEYEEEGHEESGRKGECNADGCISLIDFFKKKERGEG